MVSARDIMAQPAVKAVERNSGIIGCSPTQRNDVLRLAKFAIENDKLSIGLFIND